MGKRPFPIYQIGRAVVALYLVQLLFVFILWARDNSTRDMVFDELFTQQKTPVCLKLRRGSGLATGAIPVYGLVDRLQWWLEISIDEVPFEWIRIESPDLITIDDKIHIDQSRDVFTFFINDEKKMVVELIDDRIDVEFIEPD